MRKRRKNCLLELQEYVNSHVSKFSQINKVVSTAGSVSEDSNDER